MPASQKKPWLRFIKRDTLQERGGGKVQRTFRGEAAYVGRLRRLETVVLVLTMKLKVRDEVLDMMLRDMLDLRDVAEPKRSGGEDQGDLVPIPHEGSPDGEAERESGAELGPGGPLGHGFDPS